MTAFGPEIVAEVLAGIGANAGEIASALSRALDATLTLAAPEALSWSLPSSPAGWSGPGLLLAFPIGASGAVVLLPEEGGLLPPWCKQLDSTGEAKLATLAQELGFTLFPESHAPVESQVRHLPDLQAAVVRGKPAEGAALVKLPLIGAGRQGVLWMLWPMQAAKQALEASASPPPARSAAEPARPAAAGPVRPASAEDAAIDFDDRLERLPSYTRSLLKIKVPVVVTLASTRKPVEEILKLGLGSILQFDKPCDQTLDLEVADSPVAVGEAVKVGDKFGLRVTGVVLPEERFQAVQR